MLPKLPHPFFVLAPMYDVTDTVFRQIVSDCAPPDFFITEFVNVDGLRSEGRNHLIKYLKFTPKEKPIIAQIWGKNPDNYYEIAKELVDMGFAGININMGCPVKAVVKQGCCGALIQNRDEALTIIEATKEGANGRIPVSIKTRLGFDSIDYTWHELLLKQDLDMLMVHGRVVKQMSKGEADWEAIGKIVELRNSLTPDTLIVGNGDVTSRASGLGLAERYKLDGIMIGRGIFHDPFVFSENSPWANYTRDQRVELYAKHVQLFAKTWANNEYPVAILNKFCKIYINDFDDAKEMRKKLMFASSTDELLSLMGKTA